MKSLQLLQKEIESRNKSCITCRNYEPIVLSKCCMCYAKNKHEPIVNKLT